MALIFTFQRENILSKKFKTQGITLSLWILIRANSFAHSSSKSYQEHQHYDIFPIRQTQDKYDVMPLLVN